MREDHIEYGYDATAQSYYMTVGEADGSPVYGPNMQTVRRARHGLNRRHFPKHSETFLARNPHLAPEPSLLNRGRTALERASERAAHLNEVGASPATIAAAMGEVRRIAAKLEDIRNRQTVTAPTDREELARLLNKYKRERSAVSERINRATRHHVQGDHTKALVAELQAERIQLSKFIDALAHRFAKTEQPSDNRPERSHLVSQRMIVGSFGVEEYEPVGFAVYSTHERVKDTHVEHFYVTQFVYRTIPVRNDVEVHKLNRSYLMDGEPMLYPPKSKTYRVMEPAEAWHGPFTSIEDAEQVADYWKAECLDLYNDSDRVLGRDVEPTRLG